MDCRDTIAHLRGALTHLASEVDELTWMDAAMIRERSPAVVNALRTISDNAKNTLRNTDIRKKDEEDGQ